MWFAAKCLLLVSQWLSKCEGTGSFHNFSDHFVLLVAFNDILVFERMTFYGSFFVVGKLNIKIVHENGKSYTSFSNCAFVFQRHCAYGCTARRKEHVWSILAKHKDYRTISWLNFNSKICFYVHSYKWGKTFNLTECHIWNSCYSEDTCRSTHWRSVSSRWHISHVSIDEFSLRHLWHFVILFSLFVTFQNLGWFLLSCISDGQKVAVVYYRAGYDPKDYPTENVNVLKLWCWEMCLQRKFTNNNLEKFYAHLQI